MNWDILGAARTAVQTSDPYARLAAREREFARRTTTVSCKSMLRRPCARWCSSSSAAATVSFDAATVWAAAVLRYERTKRSTVWLVKQLDSHLCDLDRRIEERIASRAKARVDGNFEQISRDQNRLGELCVEHKSRLDSLLFMWVLGGAISVGGWARSVYREGGAAAAALDELRAASAAIGPAKTDLSAVSEALTSTIHHEFHDLRATGISARAVDQDAVEAGVRAALMTMPRALSAKGSGSQTESKANESAAAAQLRDVRQWTTCAAAVAACVLSAASLLIQFTK